MVARGPSNTAMDQLPPESLSQDLIGNPILDVFLGKASNGGGGAYIFGDYDQTKIGGTLTTIPVDNSQGFRVVIVGGITFGGKAVGRSFQGIIDTFSSFRTASPPPWPRSSRSPTMATVYTYNINYISALADFSFSIGTGKFKVSKASTRTPTVHALPVSDTTSLASLSSVMYS
ncbi:hypothetical protein BC938DRAFT_483862 [Jimgerdemannia flammicorona]|uniref:Peptidase A1 domain-containing protein n=1 Tax=Jimgerdemannia flammicorona TaxID=994334 RepID=A0A433QVN0_9FUNG|nr:hypothetical protein BC938DRAFT_483862 [Jimgerdemannia flammicorona]